MKITVLTELPPGTIIRGFGNQYWVAGKDGEVWSLMAPLTCWLPKQSEKFTEEYGPFTIIAKEDK